MKTITSETFEQEVLQAEKPVMLKFTANYCVPCKKLQPILEEIAKELEGKANIYTVDTEDSHELAAQFKVKSIPTMIVFTNGKIAATQVGSAPKDALVKLFGF